MSEPEIADFNVLFQQTLQLYEQGDYAQGYDLATRAQPLFPDREAMVMYVRACLASMDGQGAHALALLGESIDKGHWYAQPVWDDPDFNAIRESDEFARLRTISLERRDAAQALARPELVVRLPGDETPTPYPLLLALHGNNSTVAEQGDHWRPAALHGWLVGLAQSSQVGGPGQYIWDDAATSTREVSGHLDALQRAYPVDAARIVMGGFSMGAETAVRLVLSGTVPARGFVAVAMGGPLTRKPEDWEPLIEAARGRDLRGYCVTGELDAPYAPGVRRLVEMLRAAGVACELESHPDLGHIYPPDFGARLPEMLACVL
jgi:predicted esterase